MHCYQVYLEQEPGRSPVLSFVTAADHEAASRTALSMMETERCQGVEVVLAETRVFGAGSLSDRTASRSRLPWQAPAILA